jgi:hypothetical protein
MWNNYTVEMQNPGRIEDHLAEARANALEAEARAADPHSSWLAVAARRATGAAAARVGAARRAASTRVAGARLAAAERARDARHRAAVAAGHLRHPHLHRPSLGHHRP